MEEIKIGIDVDIGGTFTDCYISWADKKVATKSPTTTYDLSVGFMQALREGASFLNIPLQELLKKTETLRYSTTIAMNTLIQRTGPNLGVITTEGFEDVTFIGKGTQWQDGISIAEWRNLAKADKPKPLIPRERIVGVKERIDFRGNIVRLLDEEDVREKIDYLTRKGIRGFVISLLWAYMNPAHEKRIKEIIREEYPEAYLGNMPVVLSSEVLPKRFEYQRSMAAILNAYLHGSMSEELHGMGDELRDLGYSRPMMMVHNSGGMGTVFRTSAIQTYNGGPVAGTIGSAYVGRLHGFENVIVTDMGGTSFDLGLIAGGSPHFYAFQPVIDRFMADITMLEVMSIGAGGGSIGWINQLLGNRLEVGPQSAGSMPGPAAYDQGGTEPTVTDADVVLGYINPDYYSGGRIRLNKEKAEESIRGKIAKPYGINVIEAASLIRKVIDGKMGEAIRKEVLARGFNPADFVLFAYGGAGPTHCCSYGFNAGSNKILMFPFSPVFCAFGSSTMDITRVYEQSKRIPLLAPATKAYFSNYEEFNSVVRSLQEEAIREAEIEGFSKEQLTFSLELDMKYGGVLNIFRCSSPRLFIQSPEDVKAIYDEFEREYIEVYSSFATNPEGGVDVENFALKATIPSPKPELPVYEFKGENPPSTSLKGKRSVFWEEYGELRETPIYELSLLECGNIIKGPAVIESEDTTVVLPPQTKFTMNKYLCGEIERE